MEAAIAVIIFLLIFFFGFLAWYDILVDDEDNDVYEWSHIKQKPASICIPSCYGKGYERSVSCDDCWAKTTCNYTVGADDKED